MLASRRQQEIVKRLQRDGQVTTTDLTSSLRVSPVTIRRDLKVLEEQGVLRRSHGGAVLVEDGPGAGPHLKAFSTYAPERSLGEKASMEHAAKARIGRAAADLVQDGETIMLEAGSTVAAMLPELRKKRGLTVVTNALNIAWEMTNGGNARVVFLGGQIRPASYAAVGRLTEISLQEISVQRFFLGADGITVEAGVTTPNPDEALLARHMMARSKETIVLADYTKFGRVALSRIGAVDEFTLIITDERLGEDQARELQDAGANTLLA